MQVSKYDRQRIAWAMLNSIQRQGLMDDPEFMREVAAVREERLAKEAVKKAGSEDVK